MPAKIHLPLVCALGLVLNAGAAPVAQLGAMKDDPESGKKIDSALERIPDGANLRGVTLPAYDENLQPTSLVTARLIVKKSDNELDAHGLHVRFFRPNAEISGEVRLERADFFLKEQRLVADDALVLSSAGRGIVTRGQGGVFQLNTRRGFVYGPVFTAITREQPPDSTTMKKTTQTESPVKKRHVGHARPTRFSALPFLAALPLLSSAAPAPLTAEEKIDFERSVARAYVPHGNGKTLWSKADDTSAGIERSMLAFMSEAGLNQLVRQVKAPVAKTEKKPFPTFKGAKKKGADSLVTQEKFTELLTPGEDRFTIRADKGAYFDGTAGHLVYLGNITMRGRGITMTCHRELKTVFSQPKEKKQSKAEKKAGEGEKKDALFGDFRGIGELREIIVSGEIEIIGKNKNGQPMGARAENSVYNVAADRLIMRGGTLVFRNGDTIAFSNDPKAYVTLRLGEQSAQLEGDWRAGLPANELDQKEQEN